MDFKYKSAAELSAMTDTEKETYLVQKRNFEQNSTNEQIKTAVEEAKKEFQTALDAAKSETEAAKTTIETLKATVEEQGVKMVELTQSKEAMKGESLADTFKAKYDEAVKDVPAGSEGIDKQVLTAFTFETKAAISTDVMSVNTVDSTAFPTAGSTGVVNSTIRTIYAKLVGYFTPRVLTSRIMEFVDVQPIENATLIAINETVTGTAAVTPECTVKPVVKMTFSTQEAQADPVAVQWHTTTKLRRFFPWLVNRMEQKFLELINVAIPDGVLAAIRTGGTAFTPVTGLDISATPNNYDALGAVIATLENLGYMPDVVLMNPIAWRNMKQDKTADGVYTLSNGQSISLVDNGIDWGGRMIAIIRDPKLGLDEFIVGDIFGTVKVGVDSQAMYFETDGRTDAQATTALTGLSRNIRTHVLEKFVATIIPTGSRAGLVVDTFANVKTLITPAP